MWGFMQHPLLSRKKVGPPQIDELSITRRKMKEEFIKVLFYCDVLSSLTSLFTKKIELNFYSVMFLSHTVLNAFKYS